MHFISLHLIPSLSSVTLLTPTEEFDFAGIQTLNYSAVQSFTEIVDFPTRFPIKTQQHLIYFSPSLLALAKIRNTALLITLASLC